MLLIILGTVFILTTLDILNWGSIWRFWPLILVWIGLSLILKTRGPGLAARESNKDFMSASAFFSGIDRKVRSKNFKGGDITTIFGEANLDLREVKISSEGCQLNIMVLFGSAEILLPANTSINISGTPIFGAIDDKSTGSPDQNHSVIECRCTIAFGALDIR
ncbi:hypothetical protein JYT44_03275 [Caldithrix abyssi]|nr:hypothetical protein [Caldithrix abyssi]